MNMQVLKIKTSKKKLRIEGELDIEFDITGIHPGFPVEDKDIFEKTTLEIKTYGDILIKDIEEMVKWINKKSLSNPGEFPHFRLTIQRINPK
jgi:hypothetical protein